MSWELLPVPRRKNVYNIVTTSAPPTLSYPQDTVKPAHGINCTPKRYFLGASKKCSEVGVGLYGKDDGSGRQQWLISAAPSSSPPSNNGNTKDKKKKKKKKPKQTPPPPPPTKGRKKKKPKQTPPPSTKGRKKKKA